MQNLAATIGLLSVAVGILSTAVAAIYSLFEWRRRVSLEAARLAWELANSLHDDRVAANALELLDGETATIKTKNHGTHAVTQEDLVKALAEPGERSEKAAAIRYSFDSMFYALDRLRAVLNSKLIVTADVSSATVYYCKRLAATHRFALDYGARNGYASTVAVIERLASEASPSRPDA